MMRGTVHLYGLGTYVCGLMQGILVQLPLPSHISQKDVINKIGIQKVRYCKYLTIDTCDYACFS